MNIILSEKEALLSIALLAAVDKAIDETMKAHGEDPERWRKDPPMQDEIMYIQTKAQQLPFRIAYVRQYPDQFGQW